jgi:hypothetical protein
MIATGHLPIQLHTFDDVMALHANGFAWDKGKGRGVFIVFTLRRKGDEVLIRPISARYMHKKEIEAYEEENPDL